MQFYAQDIINNGLKRIWLKQNKNKNVLGKIWLKTFKVF